MTRVGWLDCSSGVSGDMLLGALAGVGIDRVADTAAALAVPVTHATEPVTRGGLAATSVRIGVDGDQPRRTWRDVRTLLDAARLPAAVRHRAHAVFRRLAEAEGAVHGIAPDAVHFHEVGALDALIDVVGVCWGLVELALDRLVVSEIALGAGSVSTAHGELPVPAPAVLELLRAARLPVHGGPAVLELCTPTGAALVSEWADEPGVMPAMSVTGVGVGAGGREVAGRANVVRLVVGEPVGTDPPRSTALVIEANVDDLDPRMWPAVIAGLLEAGASDAWLTPILMKKGRPAHTLHVLVPSARADEVRRAVFTETSTIGVRETEVGKRALARETARVDVAGCAVRVKLARLDGALVTASPEWDDVVAAAAVLGRPTKAVLAMAVGAAAALRPGDG